MLSRERRVEGDVERRFVVGVLLGEDDVYEIERALQGHTGALGDDEKEKDRVGKHLNRIRNQGEPYFPADLDDLRAVLEALIEKWDPETTAKWWREQGAPGADDAIAGLAAERVRQIWQARRVVELLDDIREQVFAQTPTTEYVR